LIGRGELRVRPLFVTITVTAGGVAYVATDIAWPVWRWWPVLAWMAGTVLTVSIHDAVLDHDPPEDIATLSDYEEEDEEWGWDEE
jgi:hypothetical protein